MTPETGWKGQGTRHHGAYSTWGQWPMKLILVSAVTKSCQGQGKGMKGGLLRSVWIALSRTNVIYCEPHGLFKISWWPH